MKNLKISTEEIVKTGRFEATVPAYRCETIEDTSRRQNLAVSIVLEHVGNEILLNGNIAGTITVECCRCLETYEHPVNIRFMQSYPDSEPEIDVEKEVREQLVLNMPTKPLCRTDCAGLCPQCGTNLNRNRCSCKSETHDPRWDKLKELVKKPK